MRTLALVPAKGRSTGIPGKNTRKLWGYPLVWWAVLVGNATCRKTVVSTDSGEVEEVIGHLCEVLPRPPEMCTDDAPMLDVVKHALAHFDSDVVVLLQPTQPVREVWHVEEALGLLEETGADSVVSVVQIPQHYSPDYAMRLQNDRLIPFDGIGATRRQDCKPAYSRDGTVYAIKRETIEAGSLYGGNCVPLVVPHAESVNLDDEDDWRRAEAIIKEGRS